MVKAIKPETTFSGTYMNTSIGIMDTISAINALGIANKVNNGFSIYPNPAQNVLHLTQEFSNFEQYKVQFYDINGRVLQTEIWPNNASEMQVDISKLSTGVYFIKITNGEQLIHTEKLVRM